MTIMDVFDNPRIYLLTQRLLAGNYYKKIINRLRIRKGETVCDLCCGIGDFSQELEKFKVTYFGVDLNYEYIRYAINNYRGVFFHSNIFNINYQNYFDKVFLINCIHHMDDKDFDDAVKHAKLLSKDKVIIVDMIYKDNDFINKILMDNDRGDYIRTFQEQHKIINKSFKCIETCHFESKFYKFSMVICHKENEL